MKKILGVSSSSKSTCESKNRVHDTDQMLPLGLRQFSRLRGVPTWVILKHGSNASPSLKLWRLHFLENTETDYVVHVQGRALASGTILRDGMHLVDLAGSQRVDKSVVVGHRLKEAPHINKSLSALEM